MSIQRMRQRFAVHLRIVLYLLTGIFIVTLPLVFVPGSFMGRSQQEEPRGAAQGEVIARVDGKDLTSAQFEQQFDRLLGQLLPLYASFGQSVGLDGIWQWRLNAFEQAVAEEQLLAEAEAKGISVSRGDIKEYANELAGQELSRLKESFSPEQLEARLAEVVARTEMSKEPRDQVSEKWFRRWMQKRLLKESGQLQRELLLRRVRQAVVGSASVTEQEVRASYDRATVRELLVALAPEGKAKRTEEQARARAAQLAARARKGEDQAKLVREESDDPEARRTGGLLASLPRGSKPAEWERAVFTLLPEGISDPIKTPAGYVIVRMEKIERKLPQDFEKSKQQYMNNFAQQKQAMAWQEYQRKLREKAKVEVLDPEIRAWQAMQSTGGGEAALRALRDAAAQARDREGLGPAAVFFELATALEAQKQWQGAEEAYASSHDALVREDTELPGARAEALLGMARCYEHLGENEDALLWYQAAGDASDAPAVHEELRGTYEKLGKKDLAEDEQRWLDDYARALQEQQKEREAQAAPKAPAAPPAGRQPAPARPSGQPSPGR